MQPLSPRMQLALEAVVQRERALREGRPNTALEQVFCQQPSIPSGHVLNSHA